jgi:hypothetical protein
MSDDTLIESLNTELETQFPVNLSQEDIIVPLSEYLNHLINTDFQKLVYLLYRIDVSEQKLENLLRDNPQENAGNLIAHLIIQRQLQKIESRKRFKNNDTGSAEEKW